jgi:hypothetical protein
VTIDTSYRFASTQDGLRDPHHGVELLNPQGTPVYAAADGVVVTAGDDRKTFHGPYSYFYGNLVIVKHDLPGVSEPLYTLYGHLSKILVEIGDSVRAGQEIGEVGMSGVATGSHLHFEVRWGENDYKYSINPEVWLAPLADPDGRLTGALAGRIVDMQGNALPVEDIVLEHLPAPGGVPDFSLYLKSYEEKTLADRPPYEESFAAGELPSGWYRISFVQSGMQSHLVEVPPGQLVVVTLRLK